MVEKSQIKIQLNNETTHRKEGKYNNIYCANPWFSCNSVVACPSFSISIFCEVPIVELFWLDILLPCSLLDSLIIDEDVEGETILGDGKAGLLTKPPPKAMTTHGVPATKQKAIRGQAAPVFSSQVKV